MVQQLRPYTSKAGAQVQTLVGEIGSHVPHGSTAKTIKFLKDFNKLYFKTSRTTIYKEFVAKIGSYGNMRAG